MSVVPVSGLQKFKQLPDLIICGLKHGQACQKQLRKRKSSSGLPKNQSSIMLGTLRGVYFIDPKDGEFKETIKKTQVKSWRYKWRRPCLVSWGRRSVLTSRGEQTTKPMVPTKSKRQSMHASWRLMNPRESVWNLLHQKIMKITSRRKGPIRRVTTIWCTILFLCLKRWKFRMWKQQWTKNGSCQRGRWPKKGAKRRHSWSTQRQKESPLRYTYGHLSSQKCGVRTEVSKVQRPGRAPKWHGEGRFRILSCAHRARFVCVSDASSKSNGCHCKTTWLCRTSSRRSSCLHPSENGGCSQIAQNSQIRMSRFVDTSSTTPMTKKKEKHWRSHWFLSNEMCTDTYLLASCGKDRLRKFFWNLDGKKCRIENVCFPSKTKTVLMGVREWYENGWRKARYGSHVEEIDETGRSWRTNIISWPRILGMHSTSMQTERNYYWRIKKNVRITTFCWSNWRITRAGETSRRNCRVVLRHGRSCENTRWKIYCELANQKTEKFYSVSTPGLDDHHFKKDELESVGELSKVCCQIVLKSVYLARIGRPDILWSVNKLARAVTKWTRACDRRSARLIAYIHHANDHRQCCHVGNTAQHRRLGLFQDPVCWRPWRLQINLGGSYVSSEAKHFCSHKLDVQEVNVSVSQFYRIWNLFIGCWFANGRNSRFRSMGCGDRSITCFKEHPSSSKRSLSQRWSMIKRREVEDSEKPEAHVPKPSWKEAVTETLMHCHMWITLSQTQILLSLKLGWHFSKTMKLWSKWLSRAQVLRWDTCPEFTDLR